MSNSKTLVLLIALFLPVCASAAHHPATPRITVPVTHAQPVYDTVRVNQPYEACRMQSTYARHSRAPSETVNMIGAIAGGALGRHLGHGGQEEWLGTIVGGMLGHVMTDEIQRSRHGRAHRVPVRKEVCEWVDHWETRRELVGYDVTYELAGQTFTSFSHVNPGASMEISLTPAP